METKLYIRDGSRFKYVPNMLGMYWNGTILTKERMQDSIAVVIEQHYDHVVMAFLEPSFLRMNWYAAKDWCSIKVAGGRLPSITELANLAKYISGYNFWGEEMKKWDNCAWVFGHRDGSIDYVRKDTNADIRTVIVTDVPILNLI